MGGGLNGMGVAGSLRMLGVFYFPVSYRNMPKKLVMPLSIATGSPNGRLIPPGYPFAIT